MVFSVIWDVSSSLSMSLIMQRWAQQDKSARFGDLNFGYADLKPEVIKISTEKNKFHEKNKYPFLQSLTKISQVSNAISWLMKSALAVNWWSLPVVFVLKSVVYLSIFGFGYVISAKRLKNYPEIHYFAVGVFHNLGNISQLIYFTSLCIILVSGNLWLAVPGFIGFSIGVLDSKGKLPYNAQKIISYFYTYFQPFVQLIVGDFFTKIWGLWNIGNMAIETYLNNNDVEIKVPITPYENKLNKKVLDYMVKNSSTSFEVDKTHLEETLYKSFDESHGVKKEFILDFFKKNVVYEKDSRSLLYAYFELNNVDKNKYYEELLICLRKKKEIENKYFKQANIDIDFSQSSDEIIAEDLIENYLKFNSNQVPSYFANLFLDATNISNEQKYFSKVQEYFQNLVSVEYQSEESCKVRQAYFMLNPGKNKEYFIEVRKASNEDEKKVVHKKYFDIAIEYFKSYSSTEYNFQKKKLLINYFEENNEVKEEYLKEISRLTQPIDKKYFDKAKEHFEKKTNKLFINLNKSTFENGGHIPPKKTMKMLNDIAFLSQKYMSIEPKHIKSDIITLMASFDRCGAGVYQGICEIYYVMLMRHYLYEAEVQVNSFKENPFMFYKAIVYAFAEEYRNQFITALQDHRGKKTLKEGNEEKQILLKLIKEEIYQMMTNNLHNPGKLIFYKELIKINAVDYFLKVLFFYLNQLFNNNDDLHFRNFFVHNFFGKIGLPDYGQSEEEILGVGGYIRLYFNWKFRGKVAKIFLDLYSQTIIEYLMYQIPSNILDIMIENWTEMMKKKYTENFTEEISSSNEIEVIIKSGDEEIKFPKYVKQADGQDEKHQYNYERFIRLILIDFGIFKLQEE